MYEYEVRVGTRSMNFVRNLNVVTNIDVPLLANFFKYRLVVTFCALANTIVWYRGQTASVNNISTSPFEERHYPPTQEHIAWNQSRWLLISCSNICRTREI